LQQNLPCNWPNSASATGAAALGSPPGRLAALLDQYIRVMNRIMPTSRPGFVVQAHATSGPSAAVIRYFQHKRDAAAFAAGLAHRVRASGVEALRQEA